MMRFFCILFLSFSFIFAESSVRAQSTALEVYDPTVKVEQPGISYMDALILGVVEGVTEFLPISSTGHLIISNYFLNLDGNITLRDKESGELLYDKHGDITLKRAADSYAVIIQFGAILAVAFIYWRRILSIFAGLLGRDKKGLLLFRNLMIAFLPAAVIGLCFADLIESYLFGLAPVAAALFAGGVLMLFVERWKKRKLLNPDPKSESEMDLSDLSIRQCLVIGLLQCVAMWPGTSRSMMTIVGGYAVGLKPIRAAEFSFLLGLVTLTAASAYKTLLIGGAMLRALSIGPILFGLLMASISAFLAVRWMISYLTSRGLGIFAYYRFVIAAILVGMILMAK